MGPAKKRLITIIISKIFFINILSQLFFLADKKSEALICSLPGY